MYHILLIEDELQLLENVAENLQYEGFTVDTAKNGWEGVEKALKIIPDIIVCDLMMPELDGYGVLLELRSNAKTSHIPIIFLTARTDLEDVRFGMNLGADDYLTKPCRHQDLVNAISARMLKHSQSAGQYERTVGILEEVLAKEHESSLLKTRFLSMVSHDLRSNLTSILSSQQLLKNYYDKMTPERRDTYYTRIERNVHHMLTMLDDLLMVGENVAGTALLNVEDISIAQLCNDICGDIHHLHHATHTIQLDIDDNLNPYMQADHRYLIRAITNLMNNAVKYSPEGTTVTLQVYNAENDHVMIAVQDEGIGIPPEDIENLFDIYKRANNVGRISGDGIGLAVVKQVVDLHKGQLQVQSQVDVGTRFVMTLPRTQPEPEMEAAATE